MKRIMLVSHWLKGWVVMSFAVSGLWSMGMGNSAWAARPGGGGGGSTTPLDSGTIYYYSAGGIWSMKPDGSAKTLLAPCPDS